MAQAGSATSHARITARPRVPIPEPVFTGDLHQSRSARRRRTAGACSSATQPCAVPQFLPARARHAVSRHDHGPGVGARASRWRCSPSIISCSRRSSVPAASGTRASCCSWPWRCGPGSPPRRACSAATVGLAGYAGLIRKVAFPHELVVYASVAATFTLHFAGYVVVMIVLALFGEPVHLAGFLLAMPLWLVLGARDRRPRARAGLAAGVHPRRRARADAGADDPDVPHADPLSADAGAGGAATLGGGESRSAGSSSACATRCSMAGSRCSGAMRSPSAWRSRCSRRALGVPAPVAALRGFRLRRRCSRCEDVGKDYAKVDAGARTAAPGVGPAARPRAPRTSSARSTA